MRTDESIRTPQQAQAAQRQMALARYGKVQLPQTQQAQEIYTCKTAT